METLGARIVSGGVPQGEVLDLPALGEELDVSKTALREALRVLTSKGLVDARQRKGTFVRQRDSWDMLDSDVIRWHTPGHGAAQILADLAEVRAIIEPAAAALAAARRDDVEIEQLREAQEAMRAAHGGRPEEATAADLRWHRTLLRATHNDLLARMDVFIEPGLLLRDSLVHDHGADDPVPAHDAVTMAIAAQDPEGAARAASALLEKAADDLSAVLGLTTGETS
ncbi:FadR/GntR family transcriptional regulator [Aeromicrobium sp. CF3.5]|uniref:FadR/GntR family transcriptional regulator n=1 Tax=Aeromicrobium sp. CF3.5 TaxID=3373078 RepID=UPI003EE49950